jgi:hypothetical protein
MQTYISVCNLCTLRCVQTKDKYKQRLGGVIAPCMCWVFGLHYLYSGVKNILGLSLI